MIPEIVFAFSAIAAISFLYAGKQIVFDWLKPLTTILVIAIACLNAAPDLGNFEIAIIVALLFCLAGDVFLLRDSRFVFGIGAFLIAHLIFIYAFYILNGYSLHVLSLVLFGIYGIGYFLFIQKQLNELRIPVAIYFLVILVMLWQATGNFIEDNSFINQLLMLAALFFGFSDSVIAFNKFKKNFRAAEGILLATYWTAIYLFAKSTALT